MNLGVPPFDDVHVRKALNFAYDKSGVGNSGVAPLTGANAGHVFPDGLLDNTLKDYNPYATEDDGGDLALAQAEMARSKYDSDQDGVCDDPVCENVIALGVQQDPGPKVMALFVENVQGLGIDITPKLLDGPVIYSKCISSPDKFPLCVQVGWQQDYPDAYTFGPPLFGSASLYPACCNYSLLGATDEQLSGWGYSGTHRPRCRRSDDGMRRDTHRRRAIPMLGRLRQVPDGRGRPWVPKTFANTSTSRRRIS